jgi:hypothetical protein
MAESAERVNASAPAAKPDDKRTAGAARHAELESRPAAAHVEAHAAMLETRPAGPRPAPPKLWHVVQQKQGRVRPLMQMKGAAVDPSPHLEAEADVMSPRLLSHDPASADVARPRASAPVVGSNAPIQRKLRIGGKRVRSEDAANAILAEGAQAEEDYEFETRKDAETFARAVNSLRAAGGELERAYLRVVGRALRKPGGGTLADLPPLSEVEIKKLDTIEEQLTGEMVKASDLATLHPGTIASPIWKQLRALQDGIILARKPPKKMAMHSYRGTKGNELYEKAKAGIDEAARLIDSLTLALHDRMRAEKPGSRMELQGVINSGRGEIEGLLDNISAPIAALTAKAKTHRAKKDLEERAALEEGLVGKLVAAKRVQERRLDALEESVDSGSFAGGAAAAARTLHIRNLASLENADHQEAIDAGALDVAKSANEQSLLTHVEARETEHLINGWVRDAEKKGMLIAWTLQKTRWSAEEAIAGELVAASGSLSKGSFDKILSRAEVEREIQSLLEKSVYPKVEREVGPLHVATARRMAEEQQLERMSDFPKSAIRAIGAELEARLHLLPGAGIGIKKGSKEAQKEVEYKARINPKIRID